MNKRRIRFGHLEVVSFVTGFVLMAYELVAARILAPTIGSSTYVWTSVIGTIIAALSIGYFLGGKLADKRAKPADIVLLCVASCATILLTLWMYGATLEWLSATMMDVRLQGVVASLILFVPTSLLLGMTSPYLVKLRVTSLAESGQSVASLSAWNSIGGIVGTFTTGFILFAIIGSRESMGLFALAMLAVGWLVVPKWQWQKRVVATVIFGILITGTLQRSTAHAIDTPSAHYEIVEDVEPASFRSVTLLTTGPGGAQSGVYDDAPTELLFWYTKEMAYVADQVKTKKDILVLGGGTFTLPNYLAKIYPDSRVDVVEIDPQLQAIARDHFGFVPEANLNIIAEDARTYIERTNKQYDLILVDVYNDTSIPFTFTTQEYGQALKKRLHADGAVIINTIGAMKGKCEPVVRALHAVYQAQFTYGYYTTDPHQRHDEARANIIQVYSNGNLELSGYRPIKLAEQQPFSDNFAPIELPQQQCLY